MKIGIFDPYLDTMSGGERYMLSSAKALSKNHEVYIFWDPNEKDLISKKSEDRLGLKIDDIEFTPNIFDKNTTLPKRLKESKKFNAIFLLSDGSIPLVSTNLYIHFQSPMEWVKTSPLTIFKSYRIKKIICNSQFTKEYIDKKFRVKSVVINPPVPILKEYDESKKENIILHVGRYGIKGKGTSYKKQEFIADSFVKLISNGLKNYQMHFVMSVMEDDLDLVEKFKKNYKDYPITVIVNPTHDKVWNEYELAKIYVHASGFGENITKNPDRAEHFGISTVEAMGTGVVPIVYPVGGQKEIINDKVNGLIFNDQEELIELIENLIKNDDLRIKLAKKAVIDSKNYSENIFFEKIQSTVK